MKILCFHNPNEENGYLSNWYPSCFQAENINYTSMEQYMMYQKAICFQDKSTALQILATSDPSQIKALGRIVSGYDEHQWNGLRQIIVYDGLLAKFTQNQALKKQLFDTGDSILAECAQKDRIWGIGLTMHDPDRFDRSKWQGQNLLGYALMRVRSHLNNE